MKFRSLAADDLFISYSRSDATTYANGLADQLTRRGFSCFTDRLGTDANEGLPPMLLDKIRRSTMLVLLGTKAAKASPFVGQEVAEFAKSKGTTRMIVPVIFDQDGTPASWHSLVVGIAPELERVDALQTGDPSDAVVSRIEKSFNYSRSKERLRKYTVGAAIVLAILILASVAAAGLAAVEVKAANNALQSANAARIESEQARRLADEQKRLADEQTALANNAGDRARQADKSREVAEAAQKDAQAKQQTAESQAQTAQQQADKARMAAEQQQKIADSLQLANDAESARGQTEDSLIKSVRLGQQSLQRAWSVEGDRSLRRSLALLPLSTQPKSIGPLPDSAEVVYSPDRSFAAISTAGKPLEIQDVTTGQRLARFDCPANQRCIAAISNEAKYLGTDIEGRLQVWERNHDRYKELATCAINRENTSDQILLSPDGRFLIAVRDNSDDGFELIWRINQERKSCADVTFSGMEDGATAIAFSRDGKYLAMAGRRPRLGLDFTKLNRAVVWELHDEAGDQPKPVNPDCEPISKSPFEQVLEMNIDSANLIEAIAVGVNPDSPVRWVQLAIADADTISIWREIEENNFVEAARIPAPKNLAALSFSADVKSLSVIDAKGGSIARWDTAGHRAAVQFVNSIRVHAIAFTPDGKHLATLSATNEDDASDGLRRWSVTGRTEDLWKPDDLQLGQAISIGPDGKNFSSSFGFGVETRVKIWRWEKRNSSTIEGFPGGVETIGIGPEGELFAVEDVIIKDGIEKRVLSIGRVVNNHFEALHAKLIKDKVTYLAFSLDGKWLAAATGAQVHVLRSTSLQETGNFSLNGDVNAIALSAGGEYLAAATGARTTIFNVATKKPLSSLQDDHPVSGIAFGRDNRSVATASGPTEGRILRPEDHLVRLWLFAPQELLIEADRRLTKVQR